MASVFVGQILVETQGFETLEAEKPEHTWREAEQLDESNGSSGHEHDQHCPPQIPPVSWGRFDGIGGLVFDFVEKQTGLRELMLADIDLHRCKIVAKWLQERARSRVR